MPQADEERGSAEGFSWWRPGEVDRHQPYGRRDAFRLNADPPDRAAGATGRADPPRLRAPAGPCARARAPDRAPERPAEPIRRGSEPGLVRALGAGCRPGGVWRAGQVRAVVRVDGVRGGADRAGRG